MSVYINVDTLEYPVYEQDIKTIFKNVSFESNFKPPHPFYEVLLGDVPLTDGYQTMEEESPTLIDNVWYKKFKITQLSDEAIANINLEIGERIRDKRNRLLTESDWSQVADAPVDKEAWATYRQALRDITTQEGFPHDIIWPEPPTYNVK